MAKTIQILINGKKVCLNHDRPVRNTYDGVTYQMGMLGDVVTYIQRHRGELRLHDVRSEKDVRLDKECFPRWRKGDVNCFIT